MDQLNAIVQAAALAVGALALVFVFIVALIIVQLISRFLSPPSEENLEDSLTKRYEPTPAEPKSANDDDQPREEVLPTTPGRRPIYEKYPQIYRFEILYWRGISKPWWWNNYAEDLIKYYTEYFPHKKVNLSMTYNANSKGKDYNTPSLHKRIMFLRTKKLSKHPLVVINYDEDYIMVDSFPALEAMKDRIDAEWYRHYGFKKTYRASPTEY